jgi:predicted AlkP superfamily phosphohydrolase/phosphomutase
MASRTRMLAIGIDAAEPRFVRRLIAEGQLPALAALDEQGSSWPVKAPSDLGSGAVWPTFLTGRWPAEHNFYGAWLWNADTMLPECAAQPRAAPFWKEAGSQHELGVLDVPFAPHAGLGTGFEVTDWGPHDYIQQRGHTSPAGVERLLPGRHPLAKRTPTAAHPGDYRTLTKLIRTCRRGAELRGEALAALIENRRPEVVVGIFGEVHHCAHELWHTAEPEHPLFQDLAPPPDEIRTGLFDVYREVDRQVGRLMALVGDDVPVAVFSLHGMRPVRGHAALTDPVLRHLGFQEPAPPAERSLPRSALRVIKARTPARLKRVYDRLTPAEMRFRIAAPNMISPLAWERTRAFAIPADQHGWIRVNLRGREREGSVAPEDFESVLAEVSNGLRTLQMADGRPAVAGLLRPAGDDAPPHPTLPDLVVHWSDAIHEAGAQIRGLEGEQLVDHPRYTGQHRTEGLLLGRGLGDGLAGPVDAAELHRIFLSHAQNP